MSRLESEINRGQELAAQIESTDPFGYRKTADVTPVFGLLPKESVSTIRSRTQTTNSGSVSADGSEITVSTGTTTGSTATLDTQQWGRYVPGFSAVYGVRVQIPTDPSGDEEVKWGAFNDNNGMIWGLDSTGLFLQIRDGGSDSNKIRETDFRGTLPPAFDTSNSIIYRNPFTYYGAGAVKWELFFSEAGRNKRQIIHAVSPDDKSDIGLTGGGSPLFEQPNFPIRVEVDNGTTTNDITANVIGRQFDVLGEYEPARKSVSHTVTDLSVGTSATTVASFQFKSNRRPVEVKFDSLDVINQGTERFELDVLYGTDVSNSSYGAFDGISASENPLEVDTSGSASGGEKVEDFLFKASDQNKTNTSDDATIQPVSFPKFDEASIVAESLTSSSTTIDINIAFKAEM